MNLSALQRFISHEWHLLPDAIEGLLFKIAASDEREQDQPLEKRPTEDAWGDPIDQMEFTDAGVAIIPVHGPLIKGALPSDKYYFRAVAYEDIEMDLDEAMNRGVETILLDMDSPGGTVAGMEEFAAKVDAVGQAVDLFSFNGACCASAAEYLSVGAVARFATPSSVNGSIGTILQTVDLSRLLEQMGITINQFASGKYKGTGSPWKPLTDDQRQFLHSLVRNLASNFKDRMQLYRADLTADHMEGQWFYGKEASQIGLIDELVMSRAAVLSAIS